MKKKKPKSGNYNVLIFIAGLVLLTVSAAYPAITNSSDLIRGFMTGISMMLIGTFLLKSVNRKRINGSKGR